MVIVQARTKTAHHEIMGLESEVYRRWLVYTSRDGLKIVYAECKRITLAIPSYHIEGVMGVMKTIQYPFLFGFDEEVSRFIDC